MLVNLKHPDQKKVEEQSQVGAQKASPRAAALPAQKRDPQGGAVRNGSQRTVPATRGGGKFVARGKTETVNGTYAPSKQAKK